MTLRIRPAAAALPRYRPGKQPNARAGRPAYKLSSNENPFPPLPGVLAAAQQACLELNRYPDLGVTRLTAALADRHQVAPDRIAVGTGSVAVLFHLLAVLGHSEAEVIFGFRSFEAYPIATQLSGATGVSVPLTERYEHDLPAMLAAIAPATVAVLLCTPNNPTGMALRQRELTWFVDQVPPDVTIVIDEAYAEFVTDPGAASGLTLIDRPNVVVLRTFSKAYGLAGLRIGYAIGPAELATVIRAAANPFGVTEIAQAAALASLAAESLLQDRVQTLVHWREHQLAELQRLGFIVPLSQANFVWLPVSSPDQAAAWSSTFEAAGVAVRTYVSNSAYDGIRITIGDAAANDLVLSVAAQLPR